MAYQIVDERRDYIGASTDIKPNDAKVGSTFYEYDTRAIYIYTPTGWVVM